MTTLTQLLKSRTVQFALLTAILGVLQGFVFLLPISPIQQMYVALTLAVLIVVFRFITTEPIAAK